MPRELTDAVSQVFSVLNVLEIVTLVVAALGMLTALLANVLDRVREIGVLRAVGMLRGQVRKLIVIEATFVGVVGTVGGLVLGLGYILLRYIANVQLGWYLAYEAPLRSMFEMIAITLPLSALAGYFPARRSSW